MHYIEFIFFIKVLKRERDRVSLGAGGREFQREMVEGKKEFLKAEVLVVGLM